jgi:hypothetical protein
MKKKNFLKILLILFIIILTWFIYSNFLEKPKVNNTQNLNEETKTYNSNLLENIEYISKDTKGNEYIIKAKNGEIDLNQNNIIYLVNVKGLIKLINSNEINITSDYGKYNTTNYDTIFSKSVIIEYLDNKITGEYLDFSIKRNSMIISRNVVYANADNILKADVIELNLQTKDTKIFMYDKDKKINIKNKE